MRERLYVDRNPASGPGQFRIETISTTLSIALAPAMHDTEPREASTMPPRCHGHRTYDAASAAMARLPTAVYVRRIDASGCVAAQQQARIDVMLRVSAMRPVTFAARRIRASIQRGARTQVCRYFLTTLSESYLAASGTSELRESCCAALTSAKHVEGTLRARLATGRAGASAHCCTGATVLLRPITLLSEVHFDLGT